LKKPGDIMAAKTRLYFDDSISYTDPSTFVDYPKVKLKSFGGREAGSSKKIMAYIYFLVLSSGLIFLFVK
jgi:hypothetical protein